MSLKSFQLPAVSRHKEMLHSKGVAIFNMTQEEIKYRASNILTKNDFLDLINDIQRDKWRRCYPFVLSQLNFYSYPRLCPNKYKTFTIPKKSGGVRIISSPCNNSYKQLLRCINILLTSLYYPTDNAHGFIRGRSVVTNATEHVGNKYQLNIDLKDFFTSIQRKRIIQTLEHSTFQFKPEIAYIIASICCNRIKNSKNKIAFVLPQGSPASPILTNIVCQRLDWELNALAAQSGLTYTRYADDITFSSNEYKFTPNCHIYQEIKRIIYKQRFNINFDKVRFNTIGSRMEVTGLIVGENKVNVPRKYILGIKNLLHIWQKYGSEAAEKKFLKNEKSHQTSHLPGLDNFIMGKLNYLRMVRGNNDELYQKFLIKYKEIGNKSESAWDVSIHHKKKPKLVLFDKKQRAKISTYLQDNDITCFYHFTSRENIESIKKHGGLYSWYYLDKHKIKIPHPGGSIDSRRADLRKYLADYVRLSFCEEHPMAYRHIQEGEDIIILKISTEVACLEGTKFSDKNAVDGEAIIKVGIDGLKNVNFDATKETYLTSTDPLFKYKQAEILVKTHIPIKYILNINDF